MAYYNEHLNKFYIEFLDFQNIISNYRKWIF